MMDFPHGETVTRKRRASAVDPYSGLSELAAWEDAANPPTSADIEGWGVAQLGSLEPTDLARDAVVTDYTLFRKEQADVLAGDRVVVRGDTCEVVGRPAWWHHPMTGWDAGFVVRANLVEG